jgi:single-stranded-DNA-specific exonuclease
MQPPTKRWVIADRLTDQADGELMKYHPVLRQILYNRGYGTATAAHQYVEALPPPGADAENLSNMAAAVDRIAYAIRHQEPIAVYGDYDADGVTASALLVQALQKLNAHVQGYIPDRFSEGYGLNIDALTALHQEGVRLVITVDCGIRSIQEAEHARSTGLDLIITDHHHPGSIVPPAIAVINPKLPFDTYPEKNLAGVGLAYKLAEALFRQERQPETLIEEYLDLVALGTVTDLVPLVGENRSLVRAGLEHIRQPQRQGILSLIGVSGLNPRTISAGDIAFMLGPRLNAAGRLDSALAAFNLLVTSDVAQASRYAQLLNNQNNERQRITREIQAQAEQIAFSIEPDPILLFAADPDFNPGVVGLAASRLTELYYRPAIVATKGEEFTRGSCRSIPEFHITEALDQCTDLLHHYGGHAAAAGFTLYTHLLPEFIHRLQQIATQQIGSMDLRPVLEIDADLSLTDLRADLLHALNVLQPTGMGNRSALFLTRNALVKYQRAIGKDKAHLKLILEDAQRVSHDAIAFRLGHLAGNLPNRVDLIFAFEKNEYNGQSYLQLNVRDIRPAGIG